MGNVYASVEVLASDGSYSRSFRMQVDTGCLYSQLPHYLLVDMGWAADLPPRDFTLADGAIHPSEMGHVRIRFRGQVLLDHFMFGEDPCLPLLGVRTLEEFGLGVDLVNHRLIPIAAEV